jgi:hypothetical protein
VPADRRRARQVAARCSRPAVVSTGSGFTRRACRTVGGPGRHDLTREINSAVDSPPDAISSNPAVIARWPACEPAVGWDGGVWACGAFGLATHPAGDASATSGKASSAPHRQDEGVKPRAGHTRPNVTLRRVYGPVSGQPPCPSGRHDGVKLGVGHARPNGGRPSLPKAHRGTPRGPRGGRLGLFSESVAGAAARPLWRWDTATLCNQVATLCATGGYFRVISRARRAGHREGGKAAAHPVSAQPHRYTTCSLRAISGQPPCPWGTPRRRETGSAGCPTPALLTWDVGPFPVRRVARLAHVAVPVPGVHHRCCRWGAYPVRPAATSAAEAGRWPGRPPNPVSAPVWSLWYGKAPIACP